MYLKPSHISEEVFERYTPAALSVLERLWEHVGGFHDNKYYFPPTAPLPGWFLSAVDGVKNRGVEAGWPQFGRYWDPVDWEALIKEHPEGIRFRRPGEAQMLLELRQWSRSEGLAFDLDVHLYINHDASISVEVWSLCYKKRLVPVQQSHVMALMSSYGRAGYWSESTYIACE